MTPMQTIDTYLQQAEMYKANAQWEEALSCYQRAIELQPEHWQGFNGMGDALLNLEQWEEAVVAYRRSLSLNPYFDWTYHNLSVALSRLEKVEEADIYCEKLSQLKPEFWEVNQHDFQVQQLFGDFMFRQERWEEAVAAYHRALTINPNLVWCRINLGRTLYQLEHLDEASTHFRQAIVLRPNLSVSYSYLGEILSKCHDWDGAVAAYRCLIELQPDATDAFQRLGTALMHAEKWQEAVEVFQKAIEINSNSAWLYYYLAEALDKTGHWDKAIENYRSALQLQPELAKASRRLEELVQLGQQSESVQSIAVTQDAESTFDWNFYTEYYQELKHLSTYEEAYEHWVKYGQAENRCPSEAEFYQRIGFKQTDLPKDFNCQIYLDLNPDLKSHFSGNKYATIQHFLQYGKQEGRAYNFSMAERKRLQSKINQGTSKMREIFEKTAARFRQELCNVAQYPIPPLELIKNSGSHNIAHYIDNMIFYTADIIQHCMLKRNSRVLDLGCGSGRIARGLLHYLNIEGSYVGIDVNDSAIAWCIDNLSMQNANFSFHYMHINNNYYYNDDNSQRNIYNFSFLKDRKFDCIIELSLFNHLRLEDTVQYLKEIGKRLDKDGVAYLTFFVIDEEFLSFQKRTGQHVGLRRQENGIWYGYQRQHFFAGYEQHLLQTIFEEAGLVAIASSKGSWAQKSEARIYQDWYLVTAPNATIGG